MADPLLRKPLHVILDREIDNEDADAFGHRHYAQALDDLIRNHAPPYSIGLLGTWGIGKSSIAQICRKRLANGRDPVKVVTFNAWRFGGQDIKRALFRHVFIALGGEESELNERMWSTFSRTLAEARAARERYVEFGKRCFWFVVQCLFIATPILVLAWLFGWFESTQSSRELVAPVILFASVVLRALFSKEGVLVSGFNTFAKIEAPSTTTEQFELALRHQIEKFRSKRRATKRLVVFVDDLDRLSPEEMVDGLDGIRAFLEMPCAGNTDDIGIVFVISCDEKWVARALRSRDHQPSAELPGAVFTPMDARRYLDRIFQFRLEIPPAPRRDMRSYASDMLHSLGPDFVASVEGTGKSIDDIAAHMIHPDVDSPRNALRIVNTFAQTWWLAIRREVDSGGSNRPGALYRGSVTGHPIALAVLSTLRVDFTAFYNDLTAQPSMLRHFMQVFLEGVAPVNLPPASFARLRRYAAKQAEGKSPSDSGPWPIREDYRPLQSYLSQVRSVRWPANLGALLLLSQDPVTRRLGDDGRQVYEGLIQADERSVLEAFGHQHDKKPLSRDDSEMLLNTYDEVRLGETGLYNDNAAVMLAGLADRVDVSLKRRATTDAVRRIAHQPELRWRVGIERLGQLLEGAEDDDRKDAIEYISTALWKTEGPIDATTAKGETPTVDEAIAMVSTSVDVGLKTWRSVGVHSATEDRLIHWLNSRQITVGTSTRTLPFSTLDHWLSEYRDVLSQHVGDFYIDQAVSEFENKRLSGDLADPTVRRIDELMRVRWEQSQEQDAAQWGAVARLAAVEFETAVGIAIQQASENTGNATSSQWSDFIASAVNRLAQQSSEESDGTPLPDHLERILKATQPHVETLESDSLAPFIEAAKRWSAADSTFDLAATIENHLCAWGCDEGNTLARTWVPRIASNLPDEGIRLLGKRYGRFAGDVQQLIHQQVTTYFGREALQPDGVGRLAVLLDTLPSTVVHDKPWSKALEGVRTQTAAHVVNAEWMQHASPVLARVVAFLPVEDGGAFLTELVGATDANAEARLRIYSEMGDRWPVGDEGEVRFEPGAVLASVTKTCVERPDHPKTLHVATAGVSLCERTATPAGAKQAFAKALLAAWARGPREYLDLLKRLDTLPEPGELATAALEQGEDLRDELQQLWRWYARPSPAESHQLVLRELLNLPHDSSADDPDWKLRLWIACVEEIEAGAAHGMLGDLLHDESLNADQRLRVGTIHLDGLTSDSQAPANDTDVADVIEGILGSNHEQLIRRLDDARAEIARLSALTESRRATVVKAALSGFSKATTNDGKAVAARLMNELGADKETADFAKGLSLDDVEILSGAMPGNRRLTKLKNKLATESATP